MQSIPSFDVFTDESQVRSIVYQGTANNFLSVMVEQRYPSSSKWRRSVRFLSTNYSTQNVSTHMTIACNLPLSFDRLFPALNVHVKKKMVSFSTLLTNVLAWASRYHMLWAHLMKAQSFANHLVFSCLYFQLFELVTRNYSVKCSTKHTNCSSTVVTP